MSRTRDGHTFRFLTLGVAIHCDHVLTVVFSARMTAQLLSREKYHVCALKHCVKGSGHSLRAVS